MRELIDCHIHTELSGHGGGTVGQMVSAAIFKGVAGIVFTEHLPLPEGLDPDNHVSMPMTELANYADEVRAWSERARGMQVIVGGEADWLPGHAVQTAEIRSAAHAAGIDVLLGSVHFLDDWAFDDPHQLQEWEGRDIDAVWERYFSEWCAACASGQFDVMAHPDLVKKFGHRPTRRPDDLYLEAARVAASSGVIVEVSTAGLRKPVGELYPGPDLLAAFSDAGVPATVGSDAHSTEEVGHGIESAYEALIQAGYTRVAFPVSQEETRWIEL